MARLHSLTGHAFVCESSYVLKGAPHLLINAEKEKKKEVLLRKGGRNSLQVFSTENIETSHSFNNILTKK